MYMNIKFIRNSLLLIILMLISFTSFAQLGNVINKAKDKAKSVLSTPEQTHKDEPAVDTVDHQEQLSGAVQEQPPSPESQPLKVYANYDFIPGNEIVFEDNFLTDQDGEFPAHWDLVSGQAIVNKVGTFPSLLIIDGSYGRVKPLVKTENFLSDNSTVEFDLFPASGAYGIKVFFNADQQDENQATVSLEGSEATFSGQASFNGSYPAALAEHYYEQWHHIAIGMKGTQMKVYIDQYRVLVVPNSRLSPLNVSFGGIGNEEHPIIFRDVRIANGGDQNMLNKIMTDGKFMTHAITFDVNKATIRPESMGFMSELSKWLKNNPGVKIEIDGHTDSDGDDSYNLKLSQQRAEAVKAQLIAMGIETSRLNTKGLGETKPIAANDNPLGKAQNRRVELMKI